MIYTAKYKLQLHFKACHASTVGFVGCDQPDCEATLESKQLLKFHKIAAHPSAIEEGEDEQGAVVAVDQDQHNCTYCEEQFDSKLKLDFHIGKEHKRSLLTCVPCNLSFSNYQRYEIHIQTTVSIWEKNW